MNHWQKVLVTAGLMMVLWFPSPAQISISYTSFEAYFSEGKPIRIYLDTTVVSPSNGGSGLVNVGYKGGPNVYDFSGLSFVEFVTDTLRSVSTDAFLAPRFPAANITFTIPEEGEGSEKPIISLTSSGFTIPGQHRLYTADSTRLRHANPAEPFFQFPVTFADSLRVTSDFAETTFVSGIAVQTGSFSRTKNVVIDGYGTLRLPGGGEYNVLRVRDTEEGTFTGKEFRFIMEGGGMLFVSSDDSQPDTGWVASGNDPVQYIINPNITSVQSSMVRPISYALIQNYPNPFNPSTTIRYSLPERSAVRLSIYSILGQEIAVLVAGEQEAGWHSVQWNAGGVSSGIYVARLQAGTVVKARKLVLMR